MSHVAAVRGIASPLSKTDHFFTPADLLAEWHRELRFTLDVAAHPLAPATSIIPRCMFGPEDDGLDALWANERVWCNPPYSDIAPWVEKAFDEVSQHGCPLVAQLLPANKTEQPWWQTFVEPYRDRRWERGSSFSVETRFLPRRLKFASPEDLEAKRGSGTFASVLLVWRAA